MKLRFSKTLAKRFCDTLANSDQAIFEILKTHPEFPNWKTLRRWRDKKPWFADLWRKAREDQGEHLAQKCLDIAQNATPKNAHQCRVQYDIYKWVASRFSPAIYGDRPTQPQTNIAIGVSISNERLNEIRSKLDITRSVMSREPSKLISKPVTNRLTNKTENTDENTEGHNTDITEGPHQEVITHE